LYLILSSFLALSTLSTLFKFTIKVSVPIFSHGGSIGIFHYYKNSSFHLTDYPQSCDGVWDCSSVMQNLFFKHNNTGFVALKPNPFNVSNLNHESEYFVPFYSIIISLVSIVLSIIMALVLNICNLLPMDGQNLYIDPYTIVRKY
jgi:hypothetical protein